MRGFASIRRGDSEVPEVGFPPIRTWRFMKCTLLSTIFAAACAFCSSAVAEETPQTPTMNTTANYTEVSDYEAIRATIGLYLKGCSSGKSEDMKPAFLPEAAMYWVENGELKGGPRYSDMFQRLKTAAGWKIISKIYYSHR